MKLVRFSGLLAGLLLCASVVADDELAARLGETLKKALPDATVTSVSRSPIPGIYEVMLGPSVIYMTGDGRFAIKGDVFDLQALENLTATRRAAARIEAFESVGSETMIEFAPVSGKTLRTLYVFTSGRHEYRNKGYDLTLEALARLQ